jgi:hypothetical protein
LGAPVTVTLPVTVPDEHWLEEELPELPDDPEPEQQPLDDPLPDELPLDPLHEAELESRAPSEPSPMPEATSGRTVTNSTKLAAAITPNRAHCCHRFIAKPPIRLGYPSRRRRTRLAHPGPGYPGPSTPVRLSRRPGTGPWA